MTYQEARELKNLISDVCNVTGVLADLSSLDLRAGERQDIERLEETSRSILEQLKEDDSPRNSMQVILRPSNPNEGSSVVVDTHPQATIATLISSYCSRKGIHYDSRLAVFDEKKRCLPKFTTLASLGVTPGQQLLIGEEDNSIKWNLDWPLVIAIAAAAIGFIGIISISMVYGLTGGKYPDDYGVVMDAGSSKTNTIVYKWQSSKHRGTGVVTQEKNCKANGGIAEMDPMELDPVINCAKKVTAEIIDENIRPKTPLYFAATAGMRLLNITNPNRANQILEQLSLQLNETLLSVKEIEIITGEDEGIYGWITANFLKKTLETPQQFDPWVPTTYGALDMGGASMQIAYAQPEGTEANLTLYGQTHHVFSHSNLCFGRDESERRYRYFLMIKKGIDVQVLEDPCLPKGVSVNVTAADFFQRPCTLTNLFDKDKLKKLIEQKKEYRFEGTSNPDFCRGNVSQLLDDALCLKYAFKECFKKMADIPEKQKFLAFATYAYTATSLKVVGSDMEKYYQTVQDYCMKNKSQINPDDRYAKDYCYNGEYIYQVLTTGLGFTNSTWKNIQFEAQIAGIDVGWTLGYMINQTNFIPEQAASPALISSVATALCIVLFIGILLGAVFFVCKYNRNDNK